MSNNPFLSEWVKGGANTAGRPHGTLSFVAGSTEAALHFATLPELLDRTVARHGSRDAAVFVAQNQRLSWYDLQKQTDEMAAAMLALGIRRGNRVGIWSPNRLEWLLTLFATARIGAVLVSIPGDCQGSELEHALNTVRCRMLVMAPGSEAKDHLDTLRELAPEIDRPGPVGDLTSLRLEHLKHVVVLDDLSLTPIQAAKQPVPVRALRFKEFLNQSGPAQHARLKALTASLDPDDVIHVQFTRRNHADPSASKAVTLSHFSLVNNACFAAKSMALTHEDRLCLPIALNHRFGMVLGALTATAVGAAMVFPGASFDAAATLRAVHQLRCTALHGEPEMFASMLADPSVKQWDVSCLRTGIMAGAPCPPDTMHAVIRTLHMQQVTVGFGMAETTAMAFQTHASDAVERRTSTVGRVHPHVQAKVVDQQGRIVPVGTRGQLCLRGYLLMRAYWEEPEQTQLAIDDAGWMHTGHVATIDAQGYCHIERG